MNQKLNDNDLFYAVPQQQFYELVVQNVETKEGGGGGDPGSTVC